MRRNCEVAYLAGIIDGEGTIGLYRVRRRNGQLAPWYQPIVSVTNTFAPMTRRLQRSLGGSVYPVTHKPGEVNRKKRLSRWELRRREDVKIALARLVPLLDEKRKRAKAMLSYLKGTMTARAVQKVMGGKYL